VKRLGVVAAVVLGVFLSMHRSVVHQAFVDTALGLAALAGLSLALAGLMYRAGRKAVSPARARAVTQPAVVERPRAGRPGDPCAEACGRPATRMFGQWPVCEDCGGRLDAAAGFARQPAGWPGEEPVLAGDDLPVLTQPPVIPAGETIGGVDMTEFEEAHRND
jgi:hypothetical protein